jgi:hypothetical protein
LTGKECVDPIFGRGEFGWRGVGNLVDPLARAKRQRHRLSLECGLASEQIGDRAARLAIAGGNRTCIEAGERADSDEAVIEQACVLANLFQHDELANFDAPCARLWFWQPRAF